MASLRDVLNHIGKPVQLERSGRPTLPSKAIRRGNEAFMEAKVEPESGDVLRFVDSGEAFQVVAVAGEQFLGKLDHWRLTLAPL